MNLTDVNKFDLKNKKKKRVGRGRGSGHGKTSCRGYNGANCRSGSGGIATHEGGQMPLFRRLPQRGFNNKWKQEYALINLGTLEEFFQNGDQVTMESLSQKGLLKIKKGKYMPLKILGFGDLTKKLTVEAHGFTKPALEKIQKAGGETKKLRLQSEITRAKLKRVKPKRAKKKKD